MQATRHHFHHFHHFTTTTATTGNKGKADPRNLEKTTSNIGLKRCGTAGDPLRQLCGTHGSTVFSKPAGRTERLLRFRLPGAPQVRGLSSRIRSLRALQTCFRSVPHMLKANGKSRHAEARTVPKPGICAGKGLHSTWARVAFEPASLSWALPCATVEGSCR